ncbi:MAG: transcription-repair coupling factor [Sandaracinaceae bacterium]
MNHVEPGEEALDLDDPLARELAENAKGATLLAALGRANVTLPDAVRRVVSERRVDLAGLPPAAAALLLVHARKAAGEPFVVVVPDLDAARAMANDLAFFTGRAADDDDADTADEERRVLVFPSPDVSPYVDVAPDRRASMERLATLFHLAHGLPLDFLVVPAAALVRRVPPKDALVRRSMVVRAEEELDRDKLVRTLAEGGYLRVPMVEDPGTFSVRGSLIDVYPPSASFPARIELDDYLVMSIKLFDPDDQRTVGTTNELSLHPVREALLGLSEIALARTRIRDLCDELEIPTRQAKQLIEDLESGRMVLGVEGLLPAFYESLETLAGYLPAGHRVAVLDPTAVGRAIEEELETARADHAAKLAQKAPCFPVPHLYADGAEMVARVLEGKVVLVHRLAVAGARTEGEGSFAALDSVDPDAVLSLGAEDHTLLVATLSAQRAGKGKDDALAPLAERVREWLDAGFRVVIAARTRTQADRLATLLRGYDVKVAGKPAPFSPRTLETRPPGMVEIVIGAVATGFVLAQAALALVTEEEIFGTRAHRRKEKKKKASKGADAFLEDLRQLQVGDFVVHTEHGIGRYLGLQKKILGQSKLEEMQGIASVSVEVLVVEYAGGDKLFLPVTRLHQIQKYAGGENAAPKLDRLGGQTFSKTKAKVRKYVQEMADELLRLYAQRAATKRPPLASADRTYAEFEATFPFEETADQLKAIEDVLSDLEGDHPMDRIVCGDVGFGKTEVAMRAAFRVALAGRQVAVLCPTTVLAQQHYQSFVSRMQSYPVRIETLSRFTDKKREPEILAGLKDGRVDIVVGTHRLLSKDVHFKDLGLLCVDEEQRFGVSHKERIKKLKGEVDVLTLTATPIPRTLQLAVGGLRDLSLITTAPADRRAVRTFVTRWDDHLIREAIQRELSRGGQVFFVYNRIDGLYERAAKLQALVPDARFAVVHGQMSESALEQSMTDFVAGRYDVLCATAIIESGLDIPRANTILIDRADGFGLAQLYQLRGRVGRSRERAYCYLITPPPSTLTEEARARIEALERFSELGAGFQVASLDMELRGAGDVLGAEQSGNVSLVGFDMFMHMLEEAVAELRGQPIVHEVDTEISLEAPLYLPEDYVEDVGLRLSFYKRFAQAGDEDDVLDLAKELEDRFGPPPPAAMVYVRAMRLRPALRQLRVLGCEATRERVTLHLREDTLLDPAKVMQKVAMPKSPWKLTPDMKLTRRFAPELAGESLDRVEQVLKEVQELRRAG